MELVTIVIPAYNQERYLAEALQSVIDQTHINLEIIIVDDGSTDETAKVAHEFIKNDARIHYIFQPNQGPAAARNKGIAAAKGSMIALLDADDTMDKKRIEYQLNAIQTDPSIGIVHSAIRYIDPQGHVLGESHGQDYSKEDLIVELLFRNVIPAPGAIFARRECLLHNPYHIQYKHAEDYELMLRLALQYHFKYLDIPLTNYRRHTSNLSGNLQQHRASEISILKQYSLEKIDVLTDLSSLNDQEKMLMRGKIRYNIELWHEAIEIFKTIPVALSYFYMGGAYFKLQQLDIAEKCYRHSIELDYTNPACHNNLGVLYKEKGQLEEALSCFKKALVLKEGYLDPKLNITNIENKKSTHFTFKELRKELLPY